MAKGLITAELSGLDDIIEALESLPSKAQMAVEAGAQAMMKQGKKDLQKSYLSVGGKSGDYVYSSIGFYGKPLVEASNNGPVKIGYWNSVGVFDIPELRAAKAESNNKEPDKQLNAAQIAYWIENGTSRLRSGARKPRNYTEDAFNPEEIITVAPQPFISNAFVSDWNKQREAFIKAFNKTLKELE